MSKRQSFERSKKVVREADAVLRVIARLEDTAPALPAFNPALADALKDYWRAQQ